jgi:beta-lactamase regulating signal transducer with metallopeptidase domain
MNAMIRQWVQAGLESGFCLRLSQALLHFLWQGTVIALVAAVVLWSLRRASANTRYWVGVIALLVMGASLPATLWLLPAGQRETTAAAADPAKPVVLAGGGTALLKTFTITSAPQDAGPAKNEWAAAQKISMPAAAPNSGPTANRGVRQNAQVFWEVIAPYAAAGYVVGLLVMSFRLTMSFWGGRRLCRDSTPCGDSALLTMVRNYSRRMALRIVPTVAYCRRIATPVVVGVLRPMILLPAALASGLTPEQFQAVLLHELAHIRRFDLAVNVLQRLIETLLFFHPLVWWISRRISMERENACDDLVVGMDCGRVQYADALVRVAELCGRLGPQGQTALAAAGQKPSQLKRRVLRLLGCAERPALRLTRSGLLISLLMIVCVIFAPVVWRSADGAEEKTKGEDKSGTLKTPDPLTPGPSPRKGEGEVLKPVSMSAWEFSIMPVEEQRALLARVFQRRLEHSRNLYYEVEQLGQSFENDNGKPGKFWKGNAGALVQFRHWRLGDSARMAATTGKFHSGYSSGVNAEEGLARNNTIYTDRKRPPYGQVQYATYDPNDGNSYVYWLTGSKYSRDDEDSVYTGHLFQILLEHKDDMKIAALIPTDKVLLTVPWKPWRTAVPGAKRTFLLDPRKGFLPVHCESHYDDPPTQDHPPMWRDEKFDVEESRLVGDVWMPIKIREEVAASSVPNMISVTQWKVTRIEHGTVKPADLVVPFTEGMHVDDTVLGISYTADAQGRPTGGVKLAPQWNCKPPPGWKQGSVPAEYSMASRLSPADQKMLAAERKKVELKKNQFDALVKKMLSAPTQAEQIETGIEVLRTYKFADDCNERPWALAIRKMIQIGKPAVPRLIEELDRTKQRQTLRALGFILRGIGDPRAIPALIRALPRSLEQPPHSDCGLVIQDDPELLRFMQQHDMDRTAGGAWFSYGRAFREIIAALGKMTGQTLGWQEINFANFDGSVSQLRIQRTLFLKHQRRWAEWWEKNWKEFVDAEADAQLDRNRKALDRYAQEIAAMAKPSPSMEIPCGPHVVVGAGSICQFIKSFKEWPEEGFLDLDSGKHPVPDGKLLDDSPEDKPSKELLNWASKEGVDLINVKIKQSGDEKSFYAFQPVGMKVWRIANDRYENLADEVRKSNKIKLPSPWEGPMAQLDEKTGKYDENLTASYLFVTKKGTCGAMQLQPPLSRELIPGSPTPAEGGLHYQFIYEKAPKTIDMD